MDKTAVRLVGPCAHGPQISAPLLRDLLNTLVEGAGRSLRLRLEGRSTAGGSSPAWLDKAARFDVVGFESGSAVVNLSAPSLMEAIPERFAQTEMFPCCHPEKSALAHFTESLDDAVRGNAESDLYDESLVRTFETFDRVLRHGVSSIEIVNGRRVTLDRLAIGRIRELKRSTPTRRWVRIAGRLDAIRFSDRMFTLILDNNETARGVAADEVDPSELAKLFGQVAVVSGHAHFRPSGALRRIDAEHIVSAEGDASVWSVMPTPLFGHEDHRGLRVLQGPRSGLTALLGKWPGDETDAQIEEALQSLS